MEKRGDKRCFNRKAMQAHKEEMRYNGEALVGMGGETSIFCYSVFCGTAVI